MIYIDSMVEQNQKTAKDQNDNILENSNELDDLETVEGTKRASMDAPSDEKNGYKDLNLPEPTRFGDWEVKGRCSDF